MLFIPGGIRKCENPGNEKIQLHSADGPFLQKSRIFVSPFPDFPKCISFTYLIYYQA